LPDLFTPFALGELELPNRIVMAPLTRRRAGTGKVPTALYAQYYAQRASAGLIISESTEIDPSSAGDPPTRPGLFNDVQTEGWRGVTDAVHAAGGRIVVQLSHLGRAAHPSMRLDGSDPVAPSAIAARGTVFTALGAQPYAMPRALRTDEVPVVVGHFAEAARRARLAGFDGIELHGANGYLIDQFLRDGSNQRNDRYGGNIANRTRFLIEIVEAVLGIWQPAQIGLRLSPFGTFQDMRDSDPAGLFGGVATALAPYRLGYLHVVNPAGPGTVDERQLIADLKAAFGGSFILGGGFSHASASAAIAERAADLIAFGEAFLANPDLPERFRRNAGLNKPERATFYGGGERGYIDYPFLADPP